MTRLPTWTPFGMTLGLVLMVACSAGRDDAKPDSAANVAVTDSGGLPAPRVDTVTASASDSSRGARPRTDSATSPRRPPRARPPAPSTPPPSGSTNGVSELRGTVTIVGNAPVTQVQLVAAGGGSRTLTGPELPSLRRVAGLEVALRGSAAEGGELLVRDFTVVSADGQPALDGVLEHEGSTLYLRTADRRVVLGNPPHDFHGLVGARVWLTGAPERGPHTFGVITPAR